MIGQQTPIGYVVQFMVLIQPYLWIKIHDLEFHVSEWFKYSYYVGAVLFAEIVYIYRLEIGYYNTFVLIQYIGMTVLSTYLYNQRYSIKEAVCLAFLTVYLNSYYWELPLHVMEYIQCGYYGPWQLVQLWRLFPLLFFIPRGYVTGEDWLPLGGGLGFSLAMMLYRNTGHGVDLPLQALHHPINRVVCLLVLIYVIIGERNGVAE